MEIKTASAKEIIIEKFKYAKFVYHDDIPMDHEIAEFIFDLNKCRHIITTNSCAGHDKFESGAQYDFVSHPYLAFIVDEEGWFIFWSGVLPEIAQHVLVHVEAIHDHPATEKTCIVIRCHYDDKSRFWEFVKPMFLKYFKASI